MIHAWSLAVSLLSSSFKSLRFRYHYYYVLVHVISTYLSLCSHRFCDSFLVIIVLKLLSSSSWFYHCYHQHAIVVIDIIYSLFSSLRPRYFHPSMFCHFYYFHHIPRRYRHSLRQWRYFFRQFRYRSHNLDEAHHFLS